MNKKEYKKWAQNSLLNDESEGKVNCKYDEMIPTQSLIKKMMMILMICPLFAYQSRV